MADWADGTTRTPDAPPRGFASPVVKPLADEFEKTNSAVATVEPVEHPDEFEAPAKPGRPLDEIEPMKTVERDPSLPFEGGRIDEAPDKEWDPKKPLVEVDMTAIGRGPHSAWTAAQARRPAPGAAIQPLPPGMNFPPPVGQPVAAPPRPIGPPPAGAMVHQSTDNRFVPPGTAQPALPGLTAPGPQSNQGLTPEQQQMVNQVQGTVPKTGPLTIGQAVRAAGYPMLGALAGAAFFQEVGFYLLFLAMILSGQVQREMELVRRVVMGALFIAIVMSMLPYFGVSLPWNATETYTTVASLVLLVGVPAWIFISSHRSTKT